MNASTRSEVPEHPGDFVKSEIIDPLRLSVTDAAQVLSIKRPTLSKFRNGHAHLPPEMALRIEKAFGFSMDALMRMQSNFDIAGIRKREGEINVLPSKGQNLHRQAAGARGRDD